MTHMTVLDVLASATRELVRSVDSLPEPDWGGDSLLPGWSRAHVVAHLALNAEGLTRALEGAARHEEVPQYDSDEARDRDIDVLAAASHEDLRERFLAGCTRFAEAVETMQSVGWPGTVLRAPGGVSWPSVQAPARRLDEVEIHHADLDVGYDRSHWTEASAAIVLETLSPRLKRVAPVTLRALDLDRTWTVGEGGPVVVGTAADLAWWLSGRGGGVGLSTESGALPDMSPL